MPDVKDEHQYADVIKILKGLPRIDAAAGFEMDLRRKLNTPRYEKPIPWYEKYLSPSTLIPSAALAAIVIFIFFFQNIEAPQFDDPLSVEPKVREEVMSTLPSEQPALEKLNRSRENLNATSSISFIAKTGLNFRQVNLSETERNKIKQMKEKFKNWFNKEK
jgi:nitrogen fixation-related uncharacterized protein